MEASEDSVADNPILIHALRYIATTEGGVWQVRRGTDIEEVQSLRQFQNQAELEKYANRALAQPATWVDVSAEE